VTTYEQRVTSVSGADDWSATTGSEAKSRAPNAACRAVNPRRLEIPAAATTVASSASSWKRLAKRSLPSSTIAHTDMISDAGGNTLSRASFAPAMCSTACSCFQNAARARWYRRLSKLFAGVASASAAE
jgi:hypothetical protein